MVTASYLRSNFHGGEWSKRFQGRSDLPTYPTALNVCKNALPVEQGSLTRRPGFRNLGTTRGGAQGRVIPFEFDQQTPYNMEFTDGYLRFFTGGGPSYSNDAVFVTSISTANPAVMTINTSRTWQTGDRIRLLKCTTHTPTLQGRELKVTRLTGTTYSIYDALTGTAIDGSTLGTIDPSTTAFRIYELTTPYTGTLWQTLRAVQTEKKSILLRAGTAPYVLSMTKAPVFNAAPDLATFAEFSLDAAIFQDGPYLDPVKGAIAQLNPQIWAVGTTYSVGDVVFYSTDGRNYISLTNVNVGNSPPSSLGNWSPLNPGDSSLMHLTLTFQTWSSTQGYAKGDYVLHSSTGWKSLVDGNQNFEPGAHADKWVAAQFYEPIADGVGFQTTDVGRLIRFFIEPSLWDVDHNYSLGDLAVYQGISYQALGSTTGDIPASKPTAWRIAPSTQQWTWGKVTSWLSAGEVIVQILGAPLLYNTQIRTWRLGVYSDTTGYPTCGTYHEGRLWLSGAVGNRVDSSTVDGVTDSGILFSPTDAIGDVLDTSGISYTFNAPDVNTIFWMSTDALGIVCGTQAGEWLIQATAANNPLTPTSMQAHRVTRNGCENVEPRRTPHTLIIVQRYARKMLEYFADVFSGKFQAQNLALSADHLTGAGISEIAYQQESAPVVWARCADGSLIGATYKRETIMSSQPPNIIGWHRHPLGSGRTVESICVGPSQGGSIDALSMVTASGTDYRHVEVLTDIFPEGGALEDAWFLDDAIEATSYLIDGSNLIINGLWLHNGKTVTVWAGGLDCGDYAVSSGSVTVPFGDGAGGGTGGGLFTSDFVTAFAGAMPVVCGFTYTTDAQTVRPIAPQESGARNGPAMGKKRRAATFAALLENVVTGSIKFGATFDKMRPIKLTSGGGNALTPLQTFSGVYWDTLEDDHSFDSMIAARVERPYPMTLCALEGFLETQDR